jgi:hypothetical protein
MVFDNSESSESEKELIPQNLSENALSDFKKMLEKLSTKRLNKILYLDIR